MYDKSLNIPVYVLSYLDIKDRSVYDKSLNIPVYLCIKYTGICVLNIPVYICVLNIPVYVY